ncbi:MAG: DUF2934 domain-containing protein [Candidatus Omnitrophica bacterium]|nr:DUF2934 domain-containing protein [Candidatus Omnitrophota bacterium]
MAVDTMEKAKKRGAGRKKKEKLKDIVTCNVKDKTKFYDEQLEQKIRERAYYLWKEKYKETLKACDIWFQAEKEIRSEMRKQ